MSISVAGFHDLKTVHRGAMSIVVRATRDADGRAVVLKTASVPHPTLSIIASLRREHQLLEKAKNAELVEVLDRLDHAGAPLLVLEDFGGQALGHYVQTEQPDLQTRLALCLRTTRALAALHARGVIHRDINPSNVVYAANGDALKLIDLSIATELQRETAEPEDASFVRGTLAYVAPEQTGRMNRSVDRRADLYSLGATIFELLTGRPPFTSDDPLVLVHAHLARAPVSPSTIDPSVPPLVSEIVLRLLRKVPEDRYQSASGLAADLERCVTGLRHGGRIEPFELGRDDVDGQVRFPERLYGREHEVERLLAAFEGAANGARAMVLVSGYSGIGKTALVRELYGPVSTHRGELLQGKFDQLRTGIPYAPLGSAFGGFLRQLLTRDDATIAQWRARIQQATGRLAGVLMDIMPELELVLGERPAIDPLPAAEAENRFHLVFRQLVGELAGPGHPIVLFLDDLQWADLATLRLLERLATDVDAGHLLIIGAYRHNEVDAAHPLTVTLDRLRRAGCEPERIELGPLALADVERLLADTFGKLGEESRRLAAACMAKTGGNPFFLLRFLEAAATAGVATYDRDQNAWTWQLEVLDRLGPTDNVLQFMLGRVATLEPEQQRVLQLAACIGDAFDLELLSELAGNEPAAVQRDLHPSLLLELVRALGADWLLESGDASDMPEQLRYGFVHDRIRQAAHAAMTDDDARRVHRRLAELLEARHGHEPQGSWLFEVTCHLNKARDLLTDDERRPLAARNLEAGRRARGAAAFERALEFFEAGIACLRDGSWEDDYALALALHEDAAEAAYLDADFELAHRYLARVHEHAKHQLDRVRAWEVEMDALIAACTDLRAIDVARGALKELGLALPEVADQAAIGAAVGSAMAALQQKPIEAIERSGDVKDATVAAKMSILARAASPAYYANPALLPILACELVVMSAEQGLAPASAFAFSVYGIVLNSIGMLEQGHAIGQLAIRLLDRSSDRHFEARTKHVVNNLVCVWAVPFHGTFANLQEAYRIGRETGDLEFSAIAAHSYIHNAFYGGRELHALLQEAERYGSFMKNYEQDGAARLHAPFEQVIRNMIGMADDPARLVGPSFDEQQALAHADNVASRSIRFVVLLQMLIVRYHFGEPDAAVRCAEDAWSYQDGAASTYHMVSYHTHAPLALCRALPDDPVARAATLARIEASLELLRTWAAVGPMNHAHRVALVEAELARARGHHHEAKAKYLEAMEAARSSEFLNDEALAFELAGRFHLELGGVHRTVGRAFLRDAYFAYQRWGADAKLAHLEKELPLDVSAPHDEAMASVSFDVDAAAVIRAARTISAEIELDSLLRTLFRTLIEAAGAQRALLVLRDADEWRVAIEGLADGEPRLTGDRLDDRDPADHPVGVLRYVMRTGREVLEADASAQYGTFSRDRFVQAHGTRSMLCIPVRHRGELTGALYLDHERTTGVFNPARTQLLSLLISQAAVSLDNAKLFEAQRQLTRAQSRFVPYQFLESLNRTDIARVELGDYVAKDMSVMFSDLRGFTPLTERLETHEVIALLNRYFAAMEPAIVAEDGYIDSFNGDEIMALFSGPPDSAVRAGIAMQRAVVRFNEREPHPLQMGIGINTGPLLLGTVGGSDRIKCGVVGDPVNLASRIEQRTKTYATPLLVGESTRDGLREPERFSLRRVDVVAVRGKRQVVTLYEVLDAESPERRKAKESGRDRLEEAIDCYRARRFAAACELFAACREAVPGDPVPELFIERCTRYELTPPSSDWDGCERLQSK